MPTGLFDIADREAVLQPSEIEAIWAKRDGRRQILFADWAAWRLTMVARWQRCIATAQVIDYIRTRGVMPESAFVRAAHPAIPNNSSRTVH